MQVYTFTWHIMFLVMTLPSNQTFNWRLGVILWTVGAQVNHRSVREYLVINRGRKGFLKLKSNRLEQKVLTMVCIVQFFSTYTNRLTKQPIPCMEACVRSRLLYATQAWYPNSREINELEVCWYGCLRRMVKGGFSHKRDQNTGEQLFSYTYSNLDLESIIKTPPIRQFINVQYLHYVAHICRGENTLLTKKMLFAKSNKAYFQDPWIHISKLLLVDIYQVKSATQDRVKFAELLCQRFTFLEKPDFKSAKQT